MVITVRQRRKAHALSEIRELVGDYGITATSALLEVHPDTVDRWLSGQTTPTAAVLIALRAVAKGVLPTMKHDHWRGWRFADDGMLYGPHDKRGLYPSHIAAIHFERQLLASLRLENRELRERLQRALDTGNQAANDPLLVPLTR